MANATMCGAVGYTVSSLAKELNSFPHYDVKLKSVPNTFDPANLTYWQGAGFSAALFLFIGIILMLFVLIYLCARCCCCTGGGDESDGKRGCGPLFMLIVILLCGGGVVLGYYGNEFTRKGISGAANSIISANGTVSSANSRVIVITNNLSDSGVLLDRLSNEFGKETALHPDEQREIRNEIRTGRMQVDSAREQTQGISGTLTRFPNLAEFGDLAKKYDKWRWQATIGGLCFIVLILLIAVLCIICRSVGFLQLNVFLTLIALLVAWLAGGVFVAVGVIFGDFCVDPDGYINRATNNSTRTQIVYYSRCGNCPNPFESDYNGAQDNINATLSSIANLTDAYNFTAPAATLGQLTVVLSSVGTTLTDLYSQDVNCTNLNGDYNTLLTSACSDVLQGAVLTMSGCFVLGVTLILLIIAMQLFWTRIRDESDEYEQGGNSIPMKRRFNKTSY